MYFHQLNQFILRQVFACFYLDLLDFKLDISINMKTLYIENLALDAGRTQLQFDLLTFEDSVIPTKT